MYPTGRDLVEDAMRIHPDYLRFAARPRVETAAKAVRAAYRAAWRNTDSRAALACGTAVNEAIADLNRAVEACQEPSA